MVSIFDVVVIGLFIAIIISIYRILKPENNVDIKSVTSIARKKLYKLVKSKNMSMTNVILETLKNESIEEKANKLSKIDSLFEPQKFMENIKIMFQEILDAFEKKDRNKLKTFVSKTVFNAFDENIKQFEEKKQIQDTEIIRFKKILIKDIKIDKKYATILVEFVTEQTTVLKNLDGKLLKGDDNQIELITDTWSFVRNYTKGSPGWILNETIEV